jgi:cysteinyl-tRNA synthetase
MALQIHNTASQKKETFEPLHKGEVKMYVCGPTVYDFLHVGNFRGPIFFNLVRNWLEVLGYKVNYVYNYTDVDDKIINRANEEKSDAFEISERFIAEFKKDFAALKLKPHTSNPKVTEHMDDIIAMVDDLVTREKAYVVDGEVLYSVRSFKEYGKLSNKNPDDMQAGARVEVDRKKRDPMDFALWKPAKPGEPKWEAKWGAGRPGWHIECSAMIKKILGDTIDIHGGGMDLIFPHHENEIAQSEGVTGKPFVKYWMHNNMLTFGDKKMSKSLGNIMKTRDFLEAYDGEILKYMMLQAHYRSLTDFSDKQVENSIKGLARIYSALALANEALKADVEPTTMSSAFAKCHDEASKAFANALNDDFNTPEALAAIYSVVRGFNTAFRRGQKVTPEIKATALAFTSFIHERGKLMSLFLEAPESYLRMLDDRMLKDMKLERSTVDKLVEERNQARAAKDFAKSDELRNKLTELGIAIQDTPTGTHWEVQK